ncbi:MAG: hypothetical protein CL691_01195 [Cellvibrionales bacterium]|nr:hypothetical protein [Cellvibrionales bacterium]|tara:strand:+ start:21409 stop:21657 length:249 start_codon:yes stop_codon:yes gene_type:complete
MIIDNSRVTNGGVMNLEYYPIRGRGPEGDKFQLARIIDDQGNMYKGQYDQAKHFGSEQELKAYLSKMLDLPEAELSIKKMSL